MYNCCFHYNTNLNKITFWSAKLIENSFSAVNVASSNLSAGRLPRIKISFFLLNRWALNIMSFLLNPLPWNNKRLPRASNTVPYPESESLSRSAVLVNLTAPYKKSSNVKSRTCANYHKFIIFSIWYFFHEYSQFTGQEKKGYTFIHFTGT